MLMPFQPYRDLGPAEEMASQRRPRPVAVDAYRRGDELKVELDLPGADPGSIELTVENGLLSVKATRTAFWDKTDEVQVEERLRPVRPAAVPRQEPGPGPHHRHLPRRRAHRLDPRGRAGQTAQGRGHPRRQRGPGRRGGVEAPSGRTAKCRPRARPCWLARRAETGPGGGHHSGHRPGPHRPSFGTSPSTRPAQCPACAHAPAGDEAVPPVRAGRDDDGPHAGPLKAKGRPFRAALWSRPASGTGALQAVLSGQRLRPGPGPDNSSTRPQRRDRAPTKDTNGQPHGPARRPSAAQHPTGSAVAGALKGHGRHLDDHAGPPGGPRAGSASTGSSGATSSAAAPAGYRPRRHGS